MHAITGDSVLAIAGKHGATEAVKRILLDAGYPEVLEGVTLWQAIEGDLGVCAVERIMASDPEVCISQHSMCISYR